MKNAVSFAKFALLASLVTKFLTEHLTDEEVTNLSQDSEGTARKLRAAFCQGHVFDQYADVRGDWERFYKRHFDIDVDFSKVAIPPGEGRILIIARGMTANKVFLACEKSFRCWKYTGDLDAGVSNTRAATEHYTIRVLDGAEPDAEFLGKSPSVADPDMKIGETLTERLIHGLKYYEETREHLDVIGISYCSGSRNAGGGVPGVGWNPGHGEVSVGWYDAGDGGAGNGIRQAVSA